MFDPGSVLLGVVLLQNRDEIHRPEENRYYEADSRAPPG